MRYTCPHPFCNQVALKLRHRTHDVKQKLPAGRGGVDALGVADEVDVQGCEFLQAVHQVFYRASEAVKLPNQHNIEEALVSVFHQNVKLGTATLRSAHADIYILVRPSKTR